MYWANLLRYSIALAIIMSLASQDAAAQTAATAELGTQVGVSIFTGSGETATRFAIPGAGIGVLSIVGGGSSLYATFLPGGFMIQPELGFSVLSSGGETLTLLGLTGHVGYLFSGPAASSLYVTVHPAFEFASLFGSSDSEFGAGARVGYRLLATTSLAIRFEAGYRRWFDSDLNEITIGIALGTLLGGN